jgi:hypothetical protein
LKFLINKDGCCKKILPFIGKRIKTCNFRHYFYKNNNRMKHQYLILLAITALIFACDKKPMGKKTEAKADSTTQVTEEQPVATPVVVQIGAFRKSKNADARASQIYGASVVEEGNLKKVFVTAQSEDEVAQIKQQFSGQDQPFRRLDK